MKKYDVVYILKKDIEPEELRYSIRSVVKNFPYNRIVFAGGKPEGIEPDKYIKVKQIGFDRYEKVNYTIEQVCKDEDLTEDFWLFNDDFFIMDKIKDMPHFFRGSITKRIYDITKIYGPMGGYVRAHMTTRDYLERKGYDILDYDLHVPMLVNRKAALEVLEQHPNIKLFRSLYGNVLQIGGQQMNDCKIYDTITEPDEDSLFLSTLDRSFQRGKVGEYIRNDLIVPTKYEGWDS